VERSDGNRKASGRTEETGATDAKGEAAEGAYELKQEPAAAAAAA
jgi:hypothetical protein